VKVLCAIKRKPPFIAILSAYRSVPVDPASLDWLGHHSPRDRVKGSGLWNCDHVDGAVEPDFLTRFKDLMEACGSRPVLSTHLRSPSRTQRPQSEFSASDRSRERGARCG
jgi:hypothetical protein